MKKIKKISKEEFDHLSECYKIAKEKDRSEDLEAEYKCLKALFVILETKEFKYTDFDSVSFHNNFEIHELELISDKHKSHTIIKDADFVAQFKISPHAFIDFLRVNGAVNKRDHNNKNRPIDKQINKDEMELVPKVGDYYLCKQTGFWKIATINDVEALEKKRKEPLYFNHDKPVATKKDIDVLANTEADQFINNNREAITISTPKKTRGSAKSLEASSKPNENTVADGSVIDVCKKWTVLNLTIHEIKERFNASEIGKGMDPDSSQLIASFMKAFSLNLER